MPEPWSHLPAKRQIEIEARYQSIIAARERKNRYQRAARLAKKNSSLAKENSGLT